jgi:hypothetical protein
MDPWFRLIEHSGLSIWLRESLSLLALPGVLTAHTMAMGFLAGTNVLIAIRLLGFPREVPIPAMNGLFPLIWLAFWVNVITGVLLVVAYPTKAMTNPLFYVKLVLVACSVGCVPALRRYVTGSGDADVRMTTGRGRLVAAAAISLWAATIVAGRLLPYTYSRLLVDF